VSAPVTAEELAEIERAEDFGEWWEEEPGEGCVYEYTDEGARRIIGPIEPQDAAEVVRTRDRMFRLASDLTAERARAAEIEADRDALAAKVETMLRDEEDARALRLAEHAAREDVAGKLAELQAAVRAHEEAARASGHAVPQRDLDLWAAAKA